MSTPANNPQPQQESHLSTGEGGPPAGGPPAGGDEPTEHPIIDIREEEDWKVPPKVSFDRMASLKIAKYVLIIFAGVYLLCFVMLFCMFWMTGASYEKASELVKFMLQSILPLVTLAVGYYLGDKSKQDSTSE